MYKVIQLTNQAVGAVAAGSLLPLGTITRRYGCKGTNVPTFEVSTSGADTITITEEGYYRITYNASLTGAAAGDLIVNLLTNGVKVVSSMQTSTANGVNNISLSYIVRVLPNCFAVANNSPVTIQLQLDAESVALVGGMSNIIIEKER